MLDGQQRIDPDRLDAIGRMGGNLYCRARGEALFEIARPGRAVGMGVDRLPPAVRESEVLTGSDLARLAGVAEIPAMATQSEYANDPAITAVREAYGGGADFRNKLHAVARTFLQRGEISKAWAAVLIAEKL